MPLEAEDYENSEIDDSVRDFLLDTEPRITWVEFAVSGIIVAGLGILAVITSIAVVGAVVELISSI